MSEFSKSTKMSSLIFKTAFVLMCSTGLIYQSMQLLTQYMSGETVVNVDVGKIDPDNMPGLTICHRILLNVTTFINWYKDSKLARKWRRFSENLTESTFVQSEFKRFYQDVAKLFNRSIDDGKLGFKQMKNEATQPPMLFKMAFNGDTQEYPNQFVSYEHFEWYDIITTPIHSIVWHDNIYQCYTFFSQLDIIWRNIFLNINVWYLITNDRSPWRQIAMAYDHVYLSLHSPYTFPDMEPGKYFNKLYLNQSYQIKYLQIKTELLDER